MRFLSSHHHPFGAAAVVVCGVFLAAASATMGAAAKSPPLTPRDKALFAYAACMRKKGVDIPDPVRGKNGQYAFPKIPAKVLNASGVRQKARACAANLPRGAFGGGPPSAAQRAAFQKLAACMLKHGVKIAVPTGQRPSGPPPSGGRRPPGGFFNSKDPKVRAALAKCRALLPARRAGP